MTATVTELETAVHRRCPAPEWIMLDEVSNGRGTRRSDLLGISLWGSRGIRIYGFELKVSRSDWLNELKNPAKAEEGAWSQCDRFHLVTPKGIVEPGEVPLPWWHLELVGKRLMTRQKGEDRELAIGRVWMARFLTRMQNVHEQERRAFLQKRSELQWSEKQDLIEQGREKGRAEALGDAEGLNLLVSELKSRGLRPPRGAYDVSHWVTMAQLAELHVPDVHYAVRALRNTLDTLEKVVSILDKPKQQLILEVCGEESDAGRTQRDGDDHGQG